MTAKWMADAAAEIAEFTVEYDRAYQDPIQAKALPDYQAGVVEIIERKHKESLSG